MDEVKGYLTVYKVKKIKNGALAHLYQHVAGSQEHPQTAEPQGTSRTRFLCIVHDVVLVLQQLTDFTQCRAGGGAGFTSMSRDSY